MHRRGKALGKLAKAVQWLRQQVHAPCKLSGVRVVSSHGLRGTHASIADEEGDSAHLLTKALDHTSFAEVGVHPTGSEGERDVP